LKRTDLDWRANLDIAGGSLDKIKFVRGSNYLGQLSNIVQKQEREIATL